MSARCPECWTPLDEVPLTRCRTHRQHERAAENKRRALFDRLAPLRAERDRREAEQAAYDVFIENCWASSEDIY